MAPNPSQRQLEFVSASQAAEKTRARFRIAGLVVIVGVSVLLAGWAHRNRVKFETLADLTATVPFQLGETLPNWDDPTKLAQRVLATSKHLAERPFAGKKILWVDNKHNAWEENLLGDRLSKLGLSFVHKSNFAEAVAELSKSGETFDAVITDYGEDEKTLFPSGDGKEGQARFPKLMDYLTTRNMRTPVVVYSASATEDYDRKARCRGALAEITGKNLYAWVVLALEDGATSLLDDKSRRRCIEANLFPYDTQEWRDWLAASDRGENPEIPKLAK